MVQHAGGVDQIGKQGVVQRVHRLGPVQLHYGDPPARFFHDDVLVGFLQGRRKGSERAYRRRRRRRRRREGGIGFVALASKIARE